MQSAGGNRCDLATRPSMIAHVQNINWASQSEKPTVAPLGPLARQRVGPCGGLSASRNGALRLETGYGLQN